MGRNDILTMVLGFVMFFMPMWAAIVACMFLKKHSVKTVAVVSVIPFFVWRVASGDHLLFFDKVAQMEPFWLKALFAGICGLFGLFLPYLLAIAGVLTADKLATKRRV